MNLFLKPYSGRPKKSTKNTVAFDSKHWLVLLGTLSLGQSITKSDYRDTTHRIAFKRAVKKGKIRCILNRQSGSSRQQVLTGELLVQGRRDCRKKSSTKWPCDRACYSLHVLQGKGLANSLFETGAVVRRLIKIDEEFLIPKLKLIFFYFLFFFVKFCVLINELTLTILLIAALAVRLKFEPFVSV